MQIISQPRNSDKLFAPFENKCHISINDPRKCGSTAGTLDTGWFKAHYNNWLAEDVGGS